MPALGWFYLFSSLIEHTQEMKAVAHFPEVLVDSFEPNGLFGEDFRDIEAFAPPLNLAIVTHLPDLDTGLG
jgi:hypothetical protein